MPMLPRGLDVRGNSIYVGRYIMDVSYPLVADVAQLCFELDHDPPNQSIEELERSDYAPLKELADRELAQVYGGIRKTTGTKQEGKAGVTLKLIRRMVDIAEGGPLSRRS
jgi:bacteriocin-like protein